MSKKGKKAEDLEEFEAEIANEEAQAQETEYVIPRNPNKVPMIRCARCKNEFEMPDKWFKYGIQEVRFGYSMLIKPLCKSCFEEYENFMNAYEVKR